MDKWILPTISEVLAQSELTLASCPSDKVDWAVATQNCVGDIATPVGVKNQNRVERLKAEAKWDGAIAALESSQESVEKMRQAFAQRREVIFELLDAVPGISCIKPTAPLGDTA